MMVIAAQYIDDVPVSNLLGDRIIKTIHVNQRYKTALNICHFQHLSLPN